MKMKFGVVVFPGSNCDRDMVEALQGELNQEVITLWHKDKDISMFNTEDCIVLPGGFSYGDYLRCGAIARFSPMMQSVIEFANKGGKVLGVCNGFQILCESGLLPGVLLRNAGQQFVCKNVYISNAKNGKKEALKIPVAHGEGRFYASDAAMEMIHMNDQVLYRYCNAEAEIHTNHNPNGAMDNIAGISNEQGNVVGMMPHPERACSDLLNNNDGRIVFYELYNIKAVTINSL
ncbi:MAG: phosphoribosylformylglycinamidine synthase subunit PurQ [Ferruginibacter sp.]